MHTTKATTTTAAAKSTTSSGSASTERHNVLCCKAERNLSDNVVVAEEFQACYKLMQTQFNYFFHNGKGEILFRHKDAPTPRLTPLWHMR